MVCVCDWLRDCGILGDMYSVWFRHSISGFNFSVRTSKGVVPPLCLKLQFPVHYKLLGGRVARFIFVVRMLWFLVVSLNVRKNDTWWERGKPIEQTLVNIIHRNQDVWIMLMGFPSMAFQVPGFSRTTTGALFGVSEVPQIRVSMSHRSRYIGASGWLFFDHGRARAFRYFAVIPLSGNHSGAWPEGSFVAPDLVLLYVCLSSKRRACSVVSHPEFLR